MPRFSVGILWSIQNNIDKSISFLSEISVSMSVLPAKAVSVASVQSVSVRQCPQWDQCQCISDFGEVIVGGSVPSVWSVSVCQCFQWSQCQCCRCSVYWHWCIPMWITFKYKQTCIFENQENDWFKLLLCTDRMRERNSIMNSIFVTWMLTPCW